MESKKEPSGIESAPKQSFRWLRPFLPKRAQPFLRGLRKRWQRLFLKLDEPYRTVFPFTQVHPVRQRNLVKLAETIDKESVPGDIVECGVLDGGTSALMAWASRGSTRNLHLFDAWEGLPETTAQDGADAKVWTGQVVGSPVRVARVMAELKIAPGRIKIHRGWFDKVFPTVAILSVALLHIDCDFYEPTRLCLENWWPFLASGGFIQFDDYDAFEGCRTAVDEFLSAHPEVELQTVSNQATAYFLRKP